MTFQYAVDHFPGCYFSVCLARSAPQHRLPVFTLPLSMIFFFFSGCRRPFFPIADDLKIAITSVVFVRPGQADSFFLSSFFFKLFTSKIGGLISPVARIFLQRSAIWVVVLRRQPLNKEILRPGYFPGPVRTPLGNRFGFDRT